MAKTDVNSLGHVVSGPSLLNGSDKYSALPSVTGCKAVRSAGWSTPWPGGVGASTVSSDPRSTTR